jgi:phospholipid/cholesterol/gamma-HCH transport system substrate-binding protein
MGSKAIKLTYTKPCNGADCAESGSYLEGQNLGLLQSMVTEDDVDDYVKRLGSGLTSAFDSISAKVMDSDANGAVSKSMNDIQIILSNLVATTSRLNKVMAESSGNISGVMSNLNNVTSNFAKNNDQLNSIISNFASISKEIKDAGVGSTITKTQTTMKDANGAINELQSTLEKANSSFDKLSGILTKLEKGEGTLGQLMEDKKLYDNLEGTSKQLELLLQDFRLNPKRYVNVSVFGKKQKKYEVPEDDPAEQK